MICAWCSLALTGDIDNIHLPICTTQERMLHRHSRQYDACRVAEIWATIQEPFAIILRFRTASVENLAQAIMGSVQVKSRAEYKYFKCRTYWG